MTFSRSLRSFISVLLLIFTCVVTPIFAQEESAPNPADTTTGVIFRWINFLIVFGGLAYLIAKHGGAFFHANAKAIAADILEASSAKAEAERELHDIEAKIARLDQTIGEMRLAAHRDWEAEAQRLNASGLAEIEKIKQAASAEQSAAERVAHQQLREIAASLAVKRAAGLISSGLTADVRARMFQSFLGDLNGSAN